MHSHSSAERKNFNEVSCSVKNLENFEMVVKDFIQNGLWIYFYCHISGFFLKID